MTKIAVYFIVLNINHTNFKFFVSFQTIILAMKKLAQLLNN